MLLLLVAATASPQSTDPLAVDADLEAARQVKDYYAEWLSSIPGVSKVSVAASETGEPVIKVEVTEESPQTKQIPKSSMVSESLSALCDSRQISPCSIRPDLREAAAFYPARHPKRK